MTVKTPRRFWTLVAWTIMLAALAAAAGVVEQAFSDLQQMGGCGQDDGRASFQACQTWRYAEAGAEVAVVLARVPAVGLGLVAAGMWLGAWRRARGSPPDSDDAPAEPAAAQA